MVQTSDSGQGGRRLGATKVTLPTRRQQNLALNKENHLFKLRALYSDRSLNLLLPCHPTQRAQAANAGMSRTRGLCPLGRTTMPP